MRVKLEGAEIDSSWKIPFCNLSMNARQRSRRPKHARSRIQCAHTRAQLTRIERAHCGTMNSRQLSLLLHESNPRATAARFGASASAASAAVAAESVEHRLDRHAVAKLE